MNFPSEALERVSQVAHLLTEAACKGGTAIDQPAYSALRSELLADPILGPLLPDMVRRYANLQQFRAFMQANYQSWRDRSTFINDAFSPALDRIASIAATQSGILHVPDANEYDVFISHASEDKESFVEPLAQALQQVPLRVWYDTFVLRPGDSLSSKIDEGLRDSRFGVVVLSKSFFQKRWPDSEYRAMLARKNADGSHRIIPVWHGVTREDVEQYSPLLLDILAIDSKLGVPSAVTQIVSVVRPELQPQRALTAEPERAQNAPRLEEYDLAPYKIGDPGVPIDAVPWQPYFVSQQPCLDMRFGEPQSSQINADRRWGIETFTRNVGSGTARAVRVFLPCLNVFEISTIERDSTQRISFFVDDRWAFWNYVKPPAQAVFEYEDVSGVLYRQYGTLAQNSVPSGAFYRFDLTELGKPFRVKERIVKNSTPDSWIVRNPR